MEPYVLMMQTDADDKYITESTLTEIGNTIPVRFITGLYELDDLTTVWGEPVVILLNDLGATHRGTELLKQLKSHPSRGHIPVVVLGEISTDDYIRQCYLAGANTFITKPSSIAATRKKVETFFAYWFDVAEV
jgi:response regulator RpfG family c-di-GMP phosphodiesterase